MFSYSKFVHHYTKSDFPYVRPTSGEYSVRVNGEEVPVYTCRISRYPFNTVWPGHQRPFDQSVEASFVNLVSDEALRVEVFTQLQYEKVLIKPYSKNIRHTQADGAITFTLSDNGGYVLECDDHRHLLYIFNSRPIAAPRREDVTYFFEPGIHFPGKITLRSNESLYIDKDALVYGCVYAENANNIRIFGNGILDDSHEERTGNYCYEAFVNGNMKFYDCSGLKIEGVGMTNSALWCLNLFGGSDVEVNDVKIFGQWRYNTDGIDVVNCQNVYIRNSFVHSFDDTIVIKGIDRYYNIDNQNIHTENCVLWCDWGRCCEIGIETCCREYSDISFRNCDILRASAVALDVSNGDCAEIHDVVFEDIRVEYNGFDTKEVYQSTDDMKYGAEDSLNIPTLLVVRNTPWRNPLSTELWSLPPLTDKISLEGIHARNVHDITVRNIRIYYDEAIALVDGKPDIRIRVQNQEGTEPFCNIAISDIEVNGEKFL